MKRLGNSAKVIYAENAEARHYQILLTPKPLLPLTFRELNDGKKVPEAEVVERAGVGLLVEEEVG